MIFTDHGDILIAYPESLAEKCKRKFGVFIIFFHTRKNFSVQFFNIFFGHQKRGKLLANCLIDCMVIGEDFLQCRCLIDFINLYSCCLKCINIFEYVKGQHMKLIQQKTYSVRGFVIIPRVFLI